MLPSTSFPIHYSIFIVPFNATQSEILTATLNKAQVNKINPILTRKEHSMTVKWFRTQEYFTFYAIYATKAIILTH
jgi:hypothetical protein